METYDRIKNLDPKIHGWIVSKEIEGVDHTNTRFPLTWLYSKNSEICFSPFNSFHYLWDFEVNLTPTSDSILSEVRQRFIDLGFSIEEGFHEATDSHPYYLIPTIDGHGTPFTLISLEDPSKNSTMICFRNFHLAVRIGTDSFEFATRIAKLCDHRVRDCMTIEKGTKNEFLKISFGIEDWEGPNCEIDLNGLKITSETTGWTLERKMSPF